MMRSHKLSLHDSQHFIRPVLKIEAETTPTRSIPIFIFGCERFAHGGLLQKSKQDPPQSLLTKGGSKKNLTPSP